MLRILALSALSVYAAAAQAQVYKCVDASGKTAYLQSPCPTGAKSTAITRAVPPAPTPPAAEKAGADKGDKGDKAGKDGKAASGSKTAAEQELEFRKRRQEQEKAQEKEAQKLAETKVRGENCRNARLQLINLESGARQLRMDEKGERSFLNEDQIEREKASARKLAEQWCK